jgi:hypothetical protein
MNRVDANARADAVAQTERAREQRTQNDTRNDHQASLYRGQTNFTHAHRAHAKLLSNKLRANKMRARLAQARKTRATRRGKFAAPRKTHAPVLRHAGHASMLRAHLHRAGGARVTRDGGRGGGQGNHGGQQGQGGQQQRDGRQQQRRERSWRRSASEASAPIAIDAVRAEQAMLTGKESTHPQALADACCDALLALRDTLAANPQARIDMSILKLAREATAARFAADVPPTLGLEAVVTRLAEHSSKAKHDEPASPRLAHFNLLAGLHLLMMQRPLRRSNAARADNTLAALETRNHAPVGEPS